MKCRVVPSVKGFVRKDDDILLILRSERDGGTNWSLPGGKIECYETPKEAVIREVYEETSLRISVRNILGTYSFRFIPKMSNKEHQMINIVYECSKPQGKINLSNNPDDEKIVSCERFGQNEISNLELDNRIRELMADLSFLTSLDH